MFSVNKWASRGVAPGSKFILDFFISSKFNILMKHSVTLHCLEGTNMDMWMVVTTMECMSLVQVNIIFAFGQTYHYLIILFLT